MKGETIHIVGGGLVGTLTSIFLAKRRFDVVLHERRHDMRKARIGAGRSINLAVTSRGLKALNEVGLRDAVLNVAIPMRGRMLHAADGKTTFVPYGQTPEEVIYSVARGTLNSLLLTEADRYDNVSVLFGQRCLGYQPETRELLFDNKANQSVQTVFAPHVIGTDGSGSVLRQALAAHAPNFVHSEETLAYGYKELMIPGGKENAFQMEKHALHIWPRKNFMLIALPNLDGSFTVTLFLAYAGAESFAALTTESEVEAFFQNYFADAAALMPDLTRVFFANPTGAMITVKCAPWHMVDRLLLIGDAAHAIVPFFGQGMNSGFEDCSALGELLDRTDDWDTLFARLETMRKPNADAIADLAVENFVEMRDTVADSKFQLKKQIGFALEQRYPGRFVPRYAMVVFHPEISYAQAKARGMVQDQILNTLAADISGVDELDWAKADQLMRERAN